MTAMPAPLSFRLHTPPGEAGGAGFTASRARPNVTALAAIALVHVGALALAVSTGTIRLQVASPAPIETFEVAAPAEPAPPAPEEIPVFEQVAATLPPPTLVIAPPPVVTTARPSPIRATSTPPAPVLAIANAAPRPIPVSAPAPPAPITPPNFAASQLDNPAPRIPHISRRKREEGTVVLRVLVSTEGRAQAVELESTSGFERLDEAARETVARWKFLPAQQAGHAVDAWVLVPISFSAGGRAG